MGLKIVFDFVDVPLERDPLSPRRHYEPPSKGRYPSPGHKAFLLNRRTAHMPNLTTPLSALAS